VEARRERRGEYDVVNAGSGLCIDLPGASASSGVNLQQWTCTGGACKDRKTYGAQRAIKAVAPVDAGVVRTRPFEPHSYERLPVQPASRIGELLPHRWQQSHHQ